MIMDEGHIDWPEGVSEKSLIKGMKELAEAELPKMCGNYHGVEP